MPRLTPANASLILDHVVGDPSTPAAAANALLAGLPFPSLPSPRLLRSVLLRRLASDPVSAATLDSLQLLASLPSPAAPAADAHLAVAAFLAASTPDFDAAALALFGHPDSRARRPVDEGGNPALISAEAVAVADQFEAAVGNAFSQAVLKGLWGAGLNKPTEIDDEPERDAAALVILAVDPVVPCARINSSPTGSGGGGAGGGLGEEYGRDENGEWPPAAAAARASSLEWLWSLASWWCPSPPLLPFRWSSDWREEVKMQKGHQAPLWRSGSWWRRQRSRSGGRTPRRDSAPRSRSRTP